MKKEEYKTCPYCNNMVDKKDKQCPYCLKSLSRRSTAKTGNYGITGNYTINNQTYSSTNTYDTGSDTIRDDSQKQKNEVSESNLPQVFQELLKAKGINKIYDKEEMSKNTKKVFIIFLIIFLAPSIISFIIGIISAFFD